MEKTDKLADKSAVTGKDICQNDKRKGDMMFAVFANCNFVEWTTSEKKREFLPKKIFSSSPAEHPQREYQNTKRNAINNPTD